MIRQRSKDLKHLIPGKPKYCRVTRLTFIWCFNNSPCLETRCKLTLSSEEKWLGLKFPKITISVRRLPKIAFRRQELPQITCFSAVYTRPSQASAHIYLFPLRVTFICKLNIFGLHLYSKLCFLLRMLLLLLLRFSILFSIILKKCKKVWPPMLNTNSFSCATGQINLKTNL